MLTLRYSSMLFLLVSFSFTPAFAKSRAQFNGVDAKGVEVDCDCFRIIFDDFKYYVSMNIRDEFEGLELTFQNPSDTPCKVSPYDFHLVLPSGEQIDVVEAFTDAEYGKFMLGDSPFHGIDQNKVGQPITLLPGGRKRYRLNFDKGYPLDRKKPSSFYYREELIGNFQYR